MGTSSTRRKYEVELVETVRYYVTVEAETEEEAGEIARETWADSEDPTHDFCGYGMGVELYDVTEVVINDAATGGA